MVSGNSLKICCTTTSGRVAVVNRNCVSAEHASPMGCNGNDSSISSTSASSKTITDNADKSTSWR
eukprot:CAMPEP_0174983134 /NCGR_PEP_ID=MMETSP0004_2-20121128/16946_1 /TAXON_ID=420556 /ORGANISM="Ochromonas sp., Strain CCMP1393" /LENGTH=64 /DNA_ID=CAMNT_0016235295 /DNA_START=685 /DNA_END=879 /DNA_ORIENTATION=+